MNYKSPFKTLAKCRRRKQTQQVQIKLKYIKEENRQTLRVNSFMGWLNRKESDKEIEQKKEKEMLRNCDKSRN